MIEKRLNFLYLEKAIIEEVLKNARLEFWQIHRHVIKLKAKKYEAKIHKEIAERRHLMNLFKNLDVKLTDENIKIVAEDFGAEYNKIINTKQSVRKRFGSSEESKAECFARKLAN
ncbi:MAG: hypothetical protein WC349_03085 [Patescibacteria group bacterium]